MVLQKSDIDGLERPLYRGQGLKSRIHDQVRTPHCPRRGNGVSCKTDKIPGGLGCQRKMRRRGWRVSAIGRKLLLSAQNSTSAKQIVALGL